MGTEDTRQSVFDEEGSRWNPKNWSKKGWLIAIAVFLVIIAAILIPVLVLEGLRKKSRYPEYSRLNYALTDTCALSSGLDAREYCGLICHDRLGNILLREVQLFS
jgi:hypothetical protein